MKFAFRFIEIFVTLSISLFPIAFASTSSMFKNLASSLFQNVGGNQQQPLPNLQMGSPDQMAGLMNGQNPNALANLMAAQQGQQMPGFGAGNLGAYGMGQPGLGQQGMLPNAPMYNNGNFGANMGNPTGGDGGFRDMLGGIVGSALSAYMASRASGAGAGQQMPTGEEEAEEGADGVPGQFVPQVFGYGQYGRQRGGTNAHNAHSHSTNRRNSGADEEEEDGESTNLGTERRQKAEPRRHGGSNGIRIHIRRVP